MVNIWSYISNLGNPAETRQRTIVLSNQLNFLFLISSVLLILYAVIIHLLTNNILSFGLVRIVILLLVNCLILVLTGFGFTQLSKILLIYLPLIVFLLGPTILGYIEEESYSYYPYIIIAVSIIPQLLLDREKEKIHYWFSLVYYFVLTVFIDKIMIFSAKDSFPIVERIDVFYPFYKIAQIVIFLFINASIYYLLKLNSRFEKELNKKNSELESQYLTLKRQKDEIEKQKDELVEKEISTWEKLVKIITHEIVNSAIPITNLAGMSRQMLETESGTVMKAEMISEEVATDIHQSLKIIESRTQGLIDFIKATKSLTQTQQPVIRKIFLQELCQRISVFYQFRLRESGVQFETNVKPVDLSVEADLEMIEQVIINLVQNALEALQETSFPKISVKALISETGHTQITVSDNGPGISEEVIERIFLPYYSTKPNNSGIGLSLSKQIMMLHHGRLEVNSSSKKGTEFHMIFRNYCKE